MEYKLTASIHKGTCSNSHLGHNRRTIAVPHADKNRKHLNVCYIDMSLDEAYHILFDKALEEYNAGKKPSRRIYDYLEHINTQYREGEKKLQQARSRGASTKELARIKSRYPKPYYELIVSIGNYDAYKGAFASGGDKEQIAVDVLNEYMSNFQNRNPHLFVFSAHLHRDEKSVPHIHIDYIPWTDLKGRGLSIRVSENGAFKQQNLTTGERGDIGSVAFQNQERDKLTEIAKRHGITIIEGKHSKKHLHKEEYILRQEQEKAKEDHELINSQAEELIQYQDEFLAYIKTKGVEEAFGEHIENIYLKQELNDSKNHYKRKREKLADFWKEYNDYTALFFASYRENKSILWDELKHARETSRANKKQIESILRDITHGTDFLIVKIFKLFVALFMTIDNIRYDNQVEALQEANSKLKAQAKEIMKYSNDMADTLKSCDIETIEGALNEYDSLLSIATNFIHNTAHTVGLGTNSETYR